MSKEHSSPSTPKKPTYKDTKLLIESPETINAVEYLEKQTLLEKQARELMPFNPDKCTYTMGSLRQEVYACLDCNNIGVCYSCSIQCHSDHDLVELFTKRDFTCDCGTERVNSGKARCNLRKNSDPDIPSYTNRYCHNFKGYFCDCDNKYDAEQETGEMLQCVLGIECNEDWFHDRCIMGTNQNTHVEFPKLSSFDGFICWKCVSKFQDYFDKLLKLHQEDIALPKVYHGYKLGNKRPLSEVSVENYGAELDKKLTNIPYSIFLLEDYAEKLKNIRDLPGFSEQNPYLYKFLTTIGEPLIKAEPVYQPPKEEEDEHNQDIYSLATDALANHVSRDVAIHSLQKMEQFKDSLKQFLKPFADSNKIVSKEDIQNFFNSK